MCRLSARPMATATEAADSAHALTLGSFSHQAHLEL